MSRKQILIALGAVVLIALGVAAWYVLSPPDTAATASAATGARAIRLRRMTALMGNLQGQGRSDLIWNMARPAARSAPPSTPRPSTLLKENYIDTGKVFYVFRVFPLRSDDGAAEKLARCLPEDKYFSFIDLLFQEINPNGTWSMLPDTALQSPEGVRGGLVLLQAGSPA